MATKKIPESGATFEDILMPIVEVATQSLKTPKLTKEQLWELYDGYELDDMEGLMPIKENGTELVDILAVAIQLGICQGKRIAHTTNLLVYDTQILQWLGKIEGEVCYVGNRERAYTFGTLEEVHEVIKLKDNPQFKERYQILSVRK